MQSASSLWSPAPPRGGGALGYLLDGYGCPGLQIGTPFEKQFPLKFIPRSRNGPIFLYPVLEFAPVGGALGYFLDGYGCPGLQIGTPFETQFPLKLIPGSRNGPIFLYPVLEFALKLIPRSRNGPTFYTAF